MEDKFSPEQSLHLIGTMINKAKGRFSENGHLYLLWGWAVFLCSIAEFILINYTRFEHHYLVWLTMWLVAIYQVFYLRSKKRKERVKAYTDEIIGAVWITFVVLMFLFGFLFGQLMGEEYYRFINPGFLVLYGMPTVLSGTILRFRPLIVGGIICWVFSIFSTMIDYDYQLLLLAAAVVSAWIIPGYLLKIRYKKSS